MLARTIIRTGSIALLGVASPVALTLRGDAVRSNDLCATDGLGMLTCCHEPNSWCYPWGGGNPEPNKFWWEPATQCPKS